jgi:transketolase
MCCATATAPRSLILIATGSEVGLAMGPEKLLAGKGRKVRVVSMPSTNLRCAGRGLPRGVLPAACARVAVEAGVTVGWYKYVGLDGAVVGLDRFGESGPAGELFKYFGFTAENVVSVEESVL